MADGSLRGTLGVVIPRVLSIAGSDSGGGAGIQADLKAFAACGVHGMTAITAITAQNTVGVTTVHAVPPEVIIAQVKAVADDIGVDAVKIGMLGDRPTIEAVVHALATLPETTPVVLDPVMVSESGAVLLDPEARSALAGLLFPRATVGTPNVPEARTLVGDGAGGLDAPDLARRVYALGPQVAVVTGGHREPLRDVFFDGEQLVELDGE
ncbi:MAG: hydroxymethylpyrimidine/phosphomethylpyrimidine kinase, partial [Solirubrobacterales bacterium]|nr:hydroxymethylpyrimidine/phosphomethylpyrimidine kinase [Solirubrobacterales bacterium]